MSNKRQKKKKKIKTFKPTTVNTNQISVEIDYDKLAESIVKAREKANKSEYKHSKLRLVSMKILNGMTYIGTALLMIYFIYKIWDTADFSNTAQIVYSVIFSIYFGVTGVIMFLSQQESLGESYEETRFHFNTNISLIAMIVALLALYQEIA